jgi:hypothetical protein
MNYNTRRFSEKMFDFPSREKDFFIRRQCPDLLGGPTQPPIQWVPESFSLGICGRSVKVLTDVRLMPRLRFTCTVPYVFLASGSLYKGTLAHLRPFITLLLNLKLKLNGTKICKSHSSRGGCVLKRLHGRFSGSEESLSFLRNENGVACVEWIQLAQDSVLWALMSTVTNVRGISWPAERLIASQEALCSI